MKKRTLRFLIVPNVPSPYDWRMVKGLAAGFACIGQEALALPSPLPPDELNRLCKNHSIDVVLQINRTRNPERPLPPNVRHVTWYQDVYPETASDLTDGFKESDILYALGSPEVLGLRIRPACYVSSLFTGVDPAIFDFRIDPRLESPDFSLCGALPPPFLSGGFRVAVLSYVDRLVRCNRRRLRLFWLARKILFGRMLPVDDLPYSALVTMEGIVKDHYRPLRGELDIHRLCCAIADEVQHNQLFAGDLSGGPVDSLLDRLSELIQPCTRYLLGRNELFDPAKSGVAAAVSYFSVSYPRILDRAALIAAAAAVSDSLELYGPGLIRYSFAQPYYRGVVETQNELLEIYGRSKLNLSNNTHGLGLHSRTLECMAVGGFVFMHQSPHDHAPGGMLTSFEPDVHFGSFAPETFADNARRWLSAERARREVGIRAQSVIRQSHCWHHRAQQILDDLNR